MTEEQNNSSTEDLDREAPEQEATDPEASTNPLQQALEEAAQMKEKWMRCAADFDNYRKRSRRDVADAEKKGRDGLLKDLLPVFDNLERATAHADSSGESATSVKALVDGIGMVAKQFQDALSRLGLERIAAVGQPFDPGLHEAIQHLETKDVPPGHIAAEIQPGYRDGDRLVRPALVVVAKAPVSATPAAES